MKKLACAVAVLAFLTVLVLAAGSSGAAQGNKPKYDISEVMEKAHESKLFEKVGKGEASAAEKKQLVEYYTALTQNKPPKGDPKAWKTKTEKMLDLAKKAEKGDKDAAAGLLKEVNCKACHGAFKG
jgi:hypothetical protein